MPLTALPFDNCYWVEPGGLLAGEYPGAVDDELALERLRGLLAVGVFHFIDLTEPAEFTRSGPLRPYTGLVERLGIEAGLAVTAERIAIPDMSVPDADTMTRILDTIDARIGDGGAVYVHCLGGYGRTGTVVGCMILRRGKTKRSGIFDAIAELRSGIRHSLFDSPQTREQRDFVRGWRE